MGFRVAQGQTFTRCGSSQTKKKMNPNPLEKEIEKKVGDYAKKHGVLYYKFTSPNRRAVPDRLLIAPGGVVGFLELKRKGQKPTALQQKEMQTLKDQGCRVDWVDNVEHGKAFVDKLLALAAANKEKGDEWV